MKHTGIENYKHLSELVRRDLGDISRTVLAGMLGVTERSLSEWDTRAIGDATPKALRLDLLFRVIGLIKSEFKDVPAKMYREILENSRYVFDKEDEEDGSVSLLGLINSDPKNKYWETVSKECIRNYLEMIEFKGTRFEQDKHIHHA